jgi:membrane protease YdiL (CAAX protease family)
MAQPRSVARYLAGTFAFSWSIWLGLLAAAHAGIVTRTSLGSLYAIGGAGPSLVAILLVWRADGSKGAATLARSVLNWRVPIHWYAFALLVPVVVRLLGLGLYSAVAGTDVPIVIHLVPILATFLFALIVPVMEEYGWRGYLQPALARGRSAIVVGVLVGIAWATWHLPLFWFPGTGFARWAEASGLVPAMGGYLASVVSLSMLFTLVYQRTSGALLPVFLLHDAVNTSSDVLMAPYARAGLIGPTWCVVGVLVIAACAAAWMLRNDRAYPAVGSA